MSTVTPMAAETAARLRDAPLTYAAVGQTAGELPAGYRYIRRGVVIGSGHLSPRPLNSALYAP